MKLRTITWLLILLGCAGAVTAQTEKTCPPPPGPLTGEQWVSRLDADGDGRVSAAEFDGPAERFADFDRNGDGFISAAEAPQGPPPGCPPPPPRPPRRQD